MRSKVRVERRTDGSDRSANAVIICVATVLQSADPNRTMGIRNSGPHGKYYSLSLLVISSADSRTVATIFSSAASISLA